MEVSYLFKAGDLGISNISFVFSCKIFEFRDFMGNKIFRENHKSIHKLAKFKYFVKVIMCSKFPNHVLESSLSVKQYRTVCF